MVNLRTMSWMPLVLAFFFTRDSNAAFAPADNYLLACGSSQNVTYIGQTYVPDSLHSLESKENSIAATANSSAPFLIYQSARIFHSMAFYKFDIKQEGYHWIRLYFYPLPGHNLTSASMTVVTENFVLLHNFSFKSYDGSYLFKEYVINVNSNSLILALIPSKTWSYLSMPSKLYQFPMS